MKYIIKTYLSIFLGVSLYVCSLLLVQNVFAQQHACGWFGGPNCENLGTCPNGTVEAYSCQQACDAAAQGCTPGACDSSIVPCIVPTTTPTPGAQYYCNSGSCAIGCPSGATCFNSLQECSASGCSTPTPQPTPPIVPGCVYATYNVCAYGGWVCPVNNLYLVCDTSGNGYCCTDTTGFISCDQFTPPPGSATNCTDNQQCIDDFLDDGRFDQYCGCLFNGAGDVVCGLYTIPTPPPHIQPFQCTPSGGDPNSGVDTAIGCIPADTVYNFVLFIVPWSSGIGGGIALTMIIYAGILIATSRGDPEKVAAGKELIGAAVSGLVFLILATFFVRFLGVDVLQIPGL